MWADVQGISLKLARGLRALQLDQYSGSALFVRFDELTTLQY